jgi:hypothetical protein
LCTPATIVPHTYEEANLTAIRERSGRRRRRRRRRRRTGEGGDKGVGEQT